MRGLSIVEVTVILSVLLGLVSTLFIGTSSYRKGADRSNCIINIVTVQKVMTVHVNIYNMKVGAPLALEDFVGPNLFLEQAPSCPSSGEYAVLDYVPQGNEEMFITCSLAEAEEHAPEEYLGVGLGN